MHQFWDPESPESPGDIQAKLEAYMIGHSVDVETVQTVLKKAKAKPRSGKNSDEHSTKNGLKEHVQEACEASTKPEIA